MEPHGEGQAYASDRTLTETDIMRRILRDLGSRPDMRLWRQSSGVAFRGTAAIRFGINGCADLSGILHDGRRVEIEVKTAKGRQSKQQRAFEFMIARFGGIYLIARSTEDALVQLRARGYCR